MILARAALVVGCFSALGCAQVPRKHAVQLAPPPPPSAATSTTTPVLPDLLLRCEDPASCPDAVGMLVVDRSKDQDPLRCTVTLIHGNRALTTSHCLAPEDRRPGAACARTWVVFPT